MNLFSRANAGLYLTPLERAILRFIEGTVVAAFVSMLPALSAALASQSPDWGNVGRVFLATWAVVIVMSLAKWYKAHGDTATGNLLDDAAAVLQPRAVPVAPSSVPDFPPGAATADMGLPSVPDVATAA